MCREAFVSYQKFSSRVHTRRYEELVREPRKTVEAVCAYLGELFEPDMLHFFEHVPDPMGVISHHSMLFKSVDADSVGKFTQMPLDDIGFIKTACKEAMIALGYPFSAKPEPLRVVTPSKLEFVLNRLRYYGWSWRRWRRGWARWKIITPLRIRYFLTLGWLAR